MKSDEESKSKTGKTDKAGLIGLLVVAIKLLPKFLKVAKVGKVASAAASIGVYSAMFNWIHLYDCQYGISSGNNDKPNLTGRGIALATFGLLAIAGICFACMFLTAHIPGSELAMEVLID